MKTIFSISIFFSMVVVSFGQSEMSEQSFENGIHLELYNPIQTTENFTFFGNDVITQVGSEGQRKNIFYAVGLSYERMIKRNLWIRPRIGFGSKRVTEKGTSRVNVIQDGSQSIEISEIDFEEKESHLNLFLGVIKNVEITKNIYLGMGFDLAGIFNSSLEGIFRSQSKDEDINDPTFTIEQSEKTEYSFGKSSRFGLGPVFRPEYVFDNGISLSLELQMYFMKVTRKETFRERTESSYTIAGNTETDILSLEIPQNYSQWSWSKISPLFRIGYRW